MVELKGRRRAARRRPEEMTVPGEKRVGVLLADSVQEGRKACVT